jgi:predicted phage terminase large subunit-like protein
MVIQFSHMQHAKDRLTWKGSQVPLICFDQLEEFEEAQFWYLFSRNRSARARVAPYMRATCNPVPETDMIGGWLNKLISWWIDQETGFPTWERSGVLRWFIRLGDELHWADSHAELFAGLPGIDPKEHPPKSLTFIPSKLEDNPQLERNDPTYRATLLALPLVERMRLLEGNWKIREEAGKIFKRAWFTTRLGAMPIDVVEWVRYWDKAGTEGGGKFSAGGLMGKRKSGRYLLANMVRGQWSPHNREEVIKQTAEADRKRFGRVVIWEEQEPGSGGKESAINTIRNLAGHEVHAERVTGSKPTRAGPLSSQAEAGNVDLLDDAVDLDTGQMNPSPDPKCRWNESFLAEAENFDGVHGYSDQVDAAGGAFNKLTTGPQPVRALPTRWG